MVVLTLGVGGEAVQLRLSRQPTKKPRQTWLFSALFFVRNFWRNFQVGILRHTPQDMHHIRFPKRLYSQISLEKLGHYLFYLYSKSLVNFYKLKILTSCLIKETVGG